MRYLAAGTCIAAALLTGCNSSDSDQTTSASKSLVTSVTAKTSYEDIGDAAYWVNDSDAEKSLLAVTLEGDGLAVYNRSGEELIHLTNIETTGADIRYGITSESGDSVDLLAVALPDDNAFGFYAISYENKVQLKDLGTITTDLSAEGVCLYKNTTSGELILTGITEDGTAAQYKLKYDGSEIKSVLSDDQGAPVAVRKLSVGGELSACIVDDETSTLYIAEQDLGVWAYGAAPEDINSRRLVDSIEPLGALSEIEGLDLVYLADGNGYLLAADENKGLTLYDRDTWKLAAQITAEGVDEIKSLSVADDGIWIANSELDEPRYEKLTYATLNQTAGISSMPVNSPLSPAHLSQSGVALVKVSAETEAVAKGGDAADDPAFWYNADAPEKSQIIATNKKGGLMAYSLDGTELQYLKGGRPNNVDVIQSVSDGQGGTLALAAASNRDANTIALYKIQSATDTQDPIVALNAVGSNVSSEVSQLLSGVNEVYGLCMYQSSDGTPYVFVNGKDGSIEQWRISVSGSDVSGSVVRTFSVASQPEGCVADTETAALYVGEEDKGIWKFSADESADSSAELVAEVDGKKLVADVEGLTIYNDGTNKYLIASSQGNHTYAMYDINQDHQYKGSFALIADDDNGLDGASETDGIHAVSLNLGSQYPAGLFIAQDGYNVNATYTQENQNFKLVDWQRIAAAME
ncbi:phytase [Vibrio quintilis]|uniref:3-phytase n=1 Tax=Vibrio quintilis TaxID=1117707 RepID=A0A1M7YRE0_9VIBR|nr:phytase [Vibrio quintilis]SHO55096.1 3-phytase precursor [Vibrio quintilis]